jgi:hypothetical protein
MFNQALSLLGEVREAALLHWAEDAAAGGEPLTSHGAVDAHQWKAISILFSFELYGAGGRIRTADPRITNALLYQLSYTGFVDCPFTIIRLRADDQSGPKLYPLLSPFCAGRHVESRRASCPQRSSPLLVLVPGRMNTGPPSSGTSTSECQRSEPRQIVHAAHDIDVTIDRRGSYTRRQPVLFELRERVVVYLFQRPTTYVRINGFECQGRSFQRLQMRVFFQELLRSLPKNTGCFSP